MLVHQAVADHAGQPQPVKSSDKQGSTHCPLCEVMSPFHGFVAAGLLDLPPPPPLVHIVLVPGVIQIIRLAFAAVFSARAPPFVV